MNDDRDIDTGLTALMAGDLDPRALDELAKALADDPERMRQVLGDMQLQRQLQALSDTDTAPPFALVAAAQRLEHSVAQRGWMRPAAPFAAAVALLVAGWAGHAVMHPSEPDLPPIVTAALNAQVALEMRQWMRSQPVVQEIDAAEVAAALGVDIPELPADWTILDAQIVPTPDRPGLALALHSPELGRFLMFTTARPMHDQLDPPRSFDVRGNAVAVFEQGAASYVFVDVAGHPEQLTNSASVLLSRLN